MAGLRPNRAFILLEHGAPRPPGSYLLGVERAKGVRRGVRGDGQ